LIEETDISNTLVGTESDDDSSSFFPNKPLSDVVDMSTRHFDSYLVSTKSTPLVSCIFLAVTVGDEDTNPLQSIKQSITNNNPYIHIIELLRLY